MYVSAGCATYINIPPQAGDVAEHDSNLTTVRVVQVAAIRGIVAERPSASGFRVVFPPGTTTAHAEAVVAELGDVAAGWENAQEAREDREKSPRVEIRQILVRDWFAQVDLACPTRFADADSPAQLVTVRLKWSALDQWQWQRVHVWSIGVDEALRRSRLDAEHSIRE